MRISDPNIINAYKQGRLSPFRKVYLERRFWNGQAYVYADAMDITDTLTEVSPMACKLDSDGFGTWTFDTCSLTFSNKNNCWNSANGYFNGGYIIYKSKITVAAGLRDEDGSEFSLAVFKGYIKDNYSIDMENKTCSVTLEGLLSVFEEAALEALCNCEEGEILGSFEESNKEFVTAKCAVGKIVSVKMGYESDGIENAQMLSPSEDYDAYNFHSYSEPAKIILKKELFSGQVLWCTYNYWYTDKTIEWIIAAICGYLGIEDTKIAPVVYENEIKNIFQQYTTEMFEEGSFDNTCAENDTVILKEGFPLNVNQEQWTRIKNTPTVRWETITPNSLRIWAADDVTSHQDIYYTSAACASTQAYGTWSFKIRMLDNEYYIGFISQNNGLVKHGYSVKFITYGLLGYTISLVKYVNGVETVLFSCIHNFKHLRPHFTLKISRDKQNRFRMVIYEDVYNQYRAYVVSYGIIAQDDTFTECSYMKMEFNRINYFAEITDIRLSEVSATGPGHKSPYGYYYSPVIDGGPSFSKWGAVSVNENKPEGTATALFYRSKALQEDDWSEWIGFDSSGVVISENRYLQLCWQAFSDEENYLTPELGNWKVEYFTSSITIPVVNFNSLSALDALTELARLCAYETGFDLQGNFVFRPRVSGMPACGVLDMSNIVCVLSVSGGEEKVFNRVVVNFGNFSSVADSSEDEPPTSVDKYGVKEYQISSSNFLPPESVDLAYSAAPTIYAYTSKPRRRVKLRTSFLAYYELGDIVLLNLEQDDVFKLWKWGGGVVFGDADICYYTEEMITKYLAFYKTKMRIEGMETDIENWQTVLNLTEVI